MIKKLLEGSLLGFSMLMSAQTIQKIDTSIFPKAENGMQKVVIEVPHSDQDANKKIEIFVGKNMEADTCNQHSLGGEFKSSTLKGWGYNYLTFNTKGHVRSTMMACPDNKKEMQFVSSTGYLTDYNGRMPIVIYIPEGYQAQFKIYKSDGEIYSAQEVVEK